MTIDEAFETWLGTEEAQRDDAQQQYRAWSAAVAWQKEQDLELREACEPFIKLAICIPSATTRISISGWSETGKWTGDLAKDGAVETPAAWERLAQIGGKNS